MKEGFRGPTEPAGEISRVKKRNYSQKFDRMAFTGTTELPKVWKNVSNGILSIERY